MKGKRLLIIGTALALTIAGCSNAAVFAKKEPLKTISDSESTVYTLDGTTTGGNNGYAEASDITQGGISWKVVGNTTMNPWRIGGKNLSSVDKNMYSTSAITSDINKIEIVFGAASNITVNSLYVGVYSSESGATDGGATDRIASFTPEFVANNTVTVNKTDSTSWANGYYRFTLNVSVSGNTNRFVEFRSAVFSYVENVGPTLSVSPRTVHISKNGTETLTATTTGGSGSVNWTTSDADVASISGETGSSITVRGESRGTATITASFSTADDVEVSVLVTDIQHDGTEANPFTVEEARDQLDLGTGLNGVYVTGIVSEIVTAYNSQYGTISYNISKDGSTSSEQLQAYRGKSYDGGNFTSANDIQVGATVVVTGNLVKFNTTYELGEGNQLVSYSMPGVLDTPRPHYSEGQITWDAVDHAVSYDISIDDGDAIHNAVSPYNLGVLSSPAGHKVTVTAIGSGVYSDSMPGIVKFALLTKAGTSAEPYNIPNAKAAIDGETGVNNIYVAGIISEIGSLENNAITYWISDDGTTANQFEVYKGKGLNGANFSSVDDIEVGASVVIYGSIKLYNDVYEFNSGSQLYSYTAPTQPVDYYLDRANSFATLLAHENCTVGNEEVVSKAISEVSGTTTNGTKVLELTLDAVITVSVNDGTNNGKVYGSGTEWRLYQTDSAVVTVEAAPGYVISSIKFVFTVDKTGTFEYDGSPIESDDAVAVSGNSVQFTVGNSTSATNGQVKVTEIEVSYKEYSFESVDSVALRLGAEFEQDDWDALAANYTIRDYGVMLFKRLADSQEPTLSVEDAFLDGKTLASVRKGSGEAPYLDTENHKYIFNAKVSISSSNYRLVIVAAPFIVIDDGTEDGDYHFLDQLECSAKSLADDYLDHGGSNLSSDALHVIAA